MVTLYGGPNEICDPQGMVEIMGPRVYSVLDKMGQYIVVYIVWLTKRHRHCTKQGGQNKIVWVVIVW